MAFIYKITNKTNGKKYIGKTLCTVEERWSQHIRESRKERNENRPLHRAILKYGVENFIVETIEEIPSNEAEDRERFWISFYNSFKTGYNATLGGDGRQYIDENKILKDYEEEKNMNKVAVINNCSASTVKNILKRFKIEIKSGAEVSKTSFGKKVNMLDNNEEILLTFDSQKDAARYIMENKLSNINNISGVAGKISLVCRGKRKTFAGFKWQYAF